MKSPEHILLDVSDRIATITLNRPQRRNAYVPEMGDEIVDAFATLRGDDAVRVVVLAGAGKGFCGGVDLDRLAQSRAGAEEAGRRLGEEPFLTTFPLELVAFPKPVIAAVHGAAVGVGVTMILPCDLRIAASDARFSLPFVKLGILPGLGSTHLLPRIVGLAHAQELVLTGRSIEADEALAIGLVNRVVPPDDLAKATRELAGAIADADPQVVASARAALVRGGEGSMADAMRREAQISAALRDRGD